MWRQYPDSPCYMLHPEWRPPLSLDRSVSLFRERGNGGPESSSHRAAKCVVSLPFSFLMRHIFLGLRVESCTPSPSPPTWGLPSSAWLSHHSSKHAWFTSCPAVPSSLRAKPEDMHSCYCELCKNIMGSILGGSGGHRLVQDQVSERQKGGGRSRHRPAGWLQRGSHPSEQAATVCCWLLAICL